jgi:drug/metabolite transporter (DMT)-like permease
MYTPPGTAGPKIPRAMALAFAGYTAFSMSDTCVKILAQRGYSVFEIITIDSLAACLFLLALSPWLGGLRSLKDRENAKIHAARALLNTAVNTLLVYCLSVMPIATVYTAVFTKPIMAAVLAVPLYGERLTTSRLTAIGLGLLGVVIAFEPWRSAQSAGLPILHIPLLGLTTLVIALSFLLARSLKGSSMLAMAFYPVAGSCLLTLPFMLADFRPVEMADLPFFLGSGLFVAMAVACVSHAFRIADSAAVSPLMYSQMIWAILFGSLLFDDRPGPMMLAGAVVIVASGIYLVASERRRRI